MRTDKPRQLTWMAVFVAASFPFMGVVAASEPSRLTDEEMAPFFVEKGFDYSTAAHLFAQLPPTQMKEISGKWAMTTVAPEFADPSSRLQNAPMSSKAILEGTGMSTPTYPALLLMIQGTKVHFDSADLWTWKRQEPSSYRNLPASLVEQISGAVEFREMTGVRPRIYHYACKLIDTQGEYLLCGKTGPHGDPSFPDTYLVFHK